PGAGQFDIARQLPAAVFLAEALQKLHIGGETVDVDRDRLAAGRIAGGFDLGAADQADDVGFDVGGVEAPHDQGPEAPVDADLLRLQPDSVSVGDGDGVDGEVV